MSTGRDDEKSTEEHGLTEDDFARITAYLKKPMHTRNVDDLRRPEKR